MASLPSSAILGRSFDRFDEILYLVGKASALARHGESFARARLAFRDILRLVEPFGLLPSLDDGGPEA
jgi:hypothetical protein